MAGPLLGTVTLLLQPAISVITSKLSFLPPLARFRAVRFTSPLARPPEEAAFWRAGAALFLCRHQGSPPPCPRATMPPYQSQFTHAFCQSRNTAASKQRLRSASLKNSINLTQTSKGQIRVVSRAIPPSAPPASRGRAGRGLLQQPQPQVSQAEPRAAATALHTEPCFWKRCSWQDPSYFTNIDTEISASRPRNNIFREPLICRACLFNRGDLNLSPLLSSPL